MQKLVVSTAVFSLLSLCFASGALAYKPCNPDQARRAEAYCVKRNTTYRACKAHDNGNIVAVCQLQSGDTAEFRVDRAIPMRGEKIPAGTLKKKAKQKAKKKAKKMIKGALKEK